MRNLDGAQSRVPAVRDAGRALRVASALALAIALFALAMKWMALAGQAPEAYSYDEATYAELGEHPWRSSFYPEPVFLRHPPLYFWTLAAWGTAFGLEETSTRLLSAGFAMAGAVFLWSALRRAGEATALLGAAALALAFPLHAYLVQATMYALAFLWLCLGLWARARGRERVERWAIVLLCLTHLFGFVYLALWTWTRRKEWRTALPAAWPAWLWLAAAGVAGILLQRGDDLIGAGPGGQAVRSGSVLLAIAAGHWKPQVAAILAALLMAGPALLWPAWRERAAWGPWATGALLLCAYLAVAPPFARYAVLLAPPLLVAGLPWLVRRSFPVAAAGTAALAIAAAILVPAYWSDGPDPSAANDVPGLYDMADAMRNVGGGTVAAHMPTTAAYYALQYSRQASYFWDDDGPPVNTSHEPGPPVSVAVPPQWPTPSPGLQVVDATQGPNVLLLGPTPGSSAHNLTIVRIGGPDAAAVAATVADWYIVPASWNAEAGLVALGFDACHRSTGLVVMAPIPCWKAYGFRSADDYAELLRHGFERPARRLEGWGLPRHALAGDGHL